MIEASSLLAPIGEIEAEFFPEESLAEVTERLDAYIDEGTAKAAALTGGDNDTAIAAWAYHRAYKAIYTRLLAAPSSWTLNDEGSSSYTSQQIAAFGNFANAKLAEFTKLIVPVGVASPPPHASSSTVNVFAW